MILTAQVVKNSKANYLTIEELAYLYSLYFEENWELDIFPASILKLKRNGLLNEDGSVSGVGETVLFECVEKPQETTTKDKRFEEIWSMFPRDDEFRGFPKTRMIRTNKSQAKTEYLHCLERGATSEQLITALTNEINYRSSSQKENLFTYMRSPVNWFRNDTYQDYLEIENSSSEDYGKQIL